MKYSVLLTLFSTLHEGPLLCMLCFKDFISICLFVSAIFSVNKVHFSSGDYIRLHASMFKKCPPDNSSFILLCFLQPFLVLFHLLIVFGQSLVQIYHISKVNVILYNFFQIVLYFLSTISCVFIVRYNVSHTLNFYLLLVNNFVI